MAEGKSDLTVAQKTEINHEMDILKRAARGEVSWFSGDVLKVGAKFGAGGAGGVVLGRYAGHHWFPDTDPNTGATDDQAVYKRAGLKVAVGLGGAGLLRKVSPVAAVGFAIGPIADALADVIEPTVQDTFDGWFADTGSGSGSGSGSGAGSGAGAGSGSGSGSGSGAAGAGVFFRQAR